MPSPFPGMDPYLESSVFWGGFHSRMCVAISTALNRTLPERFYADLDEHVWLETDEPDDRRLLGRPDTFVSDKNGSGHHSHETTPENGALAVALLAPSVVVTLPTVKRHKQRFVKIVGPDHSRVITVIEILSPANKDSGVPREKYLSKRDEYLATGTNLVEIDLLRAGNRMPMGRPHPPDADYYFLVCRSGQYPQADVWAFTVRDVVPAIPIPLMAGFAEVPLALQPFVTDIYDTNRYRNRIDYTQPPVPPLRATDAEWAATLMTPEKRK